MGFKKWIKKGAFAPLLGEAAQLFEDKGQWSETEREIRRMKADAAFLNSVRGSDKAEKTALFVNLSRSICWAQMQALLAIPLRMRGWNLQILSERYNARTNRIFRGYSTGEFKWWSGYSPGDATDSESESAIKDFLEKNWSFAEIKNWRYRDCSLGGQVLSSVARKTFQGFPDPNSPEIRQEIEKYLALSIQTVHQAEVMFDRIRPDVVFVIEANYAFFGIIVDVALKLGIEVIQVIQPSRDDAMVFKRLTHETRRIHPAAVSQRSMQLIEDVPWSDEMEEALMKEFGDRYGGTWYLQQRNQVSAEAMSKKEVQELLGLDPQKKTAAVFSHILWDANLFYGEDLFEDYGDWLVQTVRAAARNSNLNWVIKLHPANVWKRAYENVEQELAEVTLLKKELGDLPGHVHLLLPDCGVSTFSLFQSIDYGVTVRGTTGMEMPCLGVRTLTAGTGRYSGFGFTDDFESAGDYLAALRDLHERLPMTEEEIERAKRHAFAAFRLRPWEFKSFEAQFNVLPKGAHPLHQYFRLTAQSIDAIRENGDLDKWGDWVSDTTDVDYIDLELLEKISSTRSHYE